MTDDDDPKDEGGENACFAHLTCPECGVVLHDSRHLATCQWEQKELNFRRDDGPRCTT